MFRIGFLIASIIMISCTTESKIWYHQTIRLQPKESLVIECKKSPATLDLKNRSDHRIEIVTDLKTSKIIKAYETFQYKIPKKGQIKFINSNNQSALISYSIESNKPFNTTTNP